MKLPSPWHANASVCARAFIKPVAVRQSGLRRNRDIRGLQSLRTFDHIELHLSAFLQRAEAASLNRAEVDEHILAPVSRDEAKAFRIVEPLDGSGLTTFCGILVKGLVTGQQENFSEEFILSWKELNTIA